MGSESIFEDRRVYRSTKCGNSIGYYFRMLFIIHRVSAETIVRYMRKTSEAMQKVEKTATRREEKMCEEEA